MSRAEDRGRFDGWVELAGAAVPAAAAGFAAFVLAPSLSLAPGPAMAGGAIAIFALAFAAMRSVPPEPRQHRLPHFHVEPIGELPELLLDCVYEEPLLLVDLYEPADEALLLDDVLADPGAESRVVQLFGPQPVPTPGELKDRIDRHLAGAAGPVRGSETSAPDAADALFAALAELRRSLR